MKPRHLLMAAGLAGAAALVLFGDNRPSTEVAEAVERRPAVKGAVGVPARAAPAPVRSPKGEAKPKADPVILALIPRAELVGEAGEASFAAGEGVFLSQNWTPPPPPPPPPQPAPPPPPPSAPPLPFTYIGKAVGAGAWEVFLARGEQTFIVRDKTVIEGAYRVDSIAPPVMNLTYLPLNQVQQLNIGVSD